MDSAGSAVREKKNCFLFLCKIAMVSFALYLSLGEGIAMPCGFFEVLNGLIFLALEAEDAGPLTQGLASCEVVRPFLGQVQGIVHVFEGSFSSHSDRKNWQVLRFCDIWCLCWDSIRSYFWDDFEFELKIFFYLKIFFLGYFEKKFMHNCNFLWYSVGFRHSVLTEKLQKSKF